MTFYPGEKVIKLKSLKEYLYQWRNTAVSYERFLDVVFDHLRRVHEPVRLRLVSKHALAPVSRASSRSTPTGRFEAARSSPGIGVARRHLVDGPRRTASRWSKNSPIISPAPLPTGSTPLHPVDAERPSCVLIEGEPAFPNGRLPARLADRDRTDSGRQVLRRGPEAGSRDSVRRLSHFASGAPMTIIDCRQSVCLDSDHALSRFRWRRIPDCRHWPSLARFDGKVGRPVPIVTHFALIPRLLGHAVRRRCSGGLTQTARSPGYAREATWQAIGR